MSTKKVTRLSVFAGIVVFTLAFSAGSSWATEAKPCKEHATTTTTAKPKPTTTTTTAKARSQSQTIVHRPAAATTTTTVEVATPEQIETTGEINADDSIQPVQLASSTAPTELAHTGAHTTFLALLGALLSGIGMVVLEVRNR